MHVGKWFGWRYVWLEWVMGFFRLIPFALPIYTLPPELTPTFIPLKGCDHELLLVLTSILRCKHPCTLCSVMKVQQEGILGIPWLTPTWSYLVSWGQAISQRGKRRRISAGMREEPISGFDNGCGFTPSHTLAPAHTGHSGDVVADNAQQTTLNRY